jgi:hypothetical protein
MHMTLLGAGPTARFAADTVLWVSNGHDFVAHIVPILILTLKRLLNKLKNIEAANLVAPPAADALVDIDPINEFRRPGFTAPGGSAKR